MSDSPQPASPSSDADVVDRLVATLGRTPDRVLPLLQGIQQHYRYLPEAALRRLCEITDITPADVVGVSTFYSQFRLRPVGRHMIRVCHGTACHVKGAQRVQEALERLLGLSKDQDTDAEGRFTIEKVACLGCCTLAPVLQIDDVTYGHLTPESVPKAVQDFLELEKRGAVAPRSQPQGSATPPLGEIRIGVGSCCVAGGSLDVRRALESTIIDLAVPVAVKPVGCVGMCHQTPLVEICQPDAPAVLYAKVTPDEARRIVLRHFRPRGMLRRLEANVFTAIDRLVTDQAWEPVTRYALDVREGPVCTFLGRQMRIASELCGELDPLDMDEYIAHEGFKALRACLQDADPEGIIASVTAAGLRGRGGAGFPTGRKWTMVRAAEGRPKYLICNGDEGDPGAFMDRMLLESYPYRVLEGMLIAAYALGAQEGCLYIRAEYPLALRRMREALATMEKRGYLGSDILGSGFELRLRIVEGAGAFVSGEETGLLAAVEGRRSMPRFRPPYPAQSGLWGRPTCINNVETFALVPWILRHGAETFARIGTSASKGTKVFSLAGKIVRGGLIEVPMGVTLRDIVEEIGGGVPEGRTFKAVQVGGPSGGCLPASLCNTTVDYEALTSVGAIMGSGGLVVMDDSDCMVDIARYFMSFTQRESCGKCTHCRIGTKRMLEILERLCEGRAQKDDLQHLELLANTTRAGSLCGLGRTAPNPVLTTLRYFRDEYEAHLQGRCPARRCKALIRYTISDECIGCTRCAQRCPVDAIPFNPHHKHEIDTEKCIRCDACRVACPVGAVKVE